MSALDKLTDEEYKLLRQDYLDELACMNDIDDDELQVMLYVSTNTIKVPRRIPANSGRYPRKEN